MFGFRPLAVPCPPWPWPFLLGPPLPGIATGRMDRSSLVSASDLDGNGGRQSCDGSAETNKAEFVNGSALDCGAAGNGWN